MADSQRKTANLFIQKLTGATIASSGEIVSDANYDTYIAEVSDGETYTVSNVTGTQVFGFFTTEPALGTITYNSSRTIFSTPSQTLTVPTGENIKYIGVRYNTGVSNAMLNTGGTPLPYEPYGWLHSLRKLTTATDTITTLPADLYADGTNATVGLVGNMSQTGTPTPQNPIQPSECGDRTGNLFPDIPSTANASLVQNTGQEIANNEFDIYTIPVTGETKYTIAFSPGAGTGGRMTSVHQYNGDTWISALVVTTNVSFPQTVTTDTNATKIKISILKNTSNRRCNVGETALPYQPYGYKLDIKSANTTTPVYLGEVETTRKIREFVLDGTENWFLSTAQAGRFGLSLSDYLKSNGTITSFCSHYTAIAQKSGGTAPNNSQYFYSGSDSTRYIFIVDMSCSTAADFKAYLAQQYAAGTPVTIWYVLATEETGIVNEPLRKIGVYADTVSGISIPTITGADSFDVLTTLKPSEVSLSYTGWHDASVGEWDGSEWQ